MTVEKQYSGDTPEAVDEEVERRWLSFLRRFEEVIWPTLYAGRGISKDVALLSWQLSYLQGETEAMVRLIERLEVDG